jgi:hypothetical protein
MLVIAEVALDSSAAVVITVGSMSGHTSTTGAESPARYMDARLVRALIAYWMLLAASPQVPTAAIAARSVVEPEMTVVDFLASYSVGAPLPGPALGPLVPEAFGLGAFGAATTWLAALTGMAAETLAADGDAVSAASTRTVVSDEAKIISPRYVRVHRSVVPLFAGAGLCAVTATVAHSGCLDSSARPDYGRGMCRNIHTLHNFEPAANDDEVQAAALQYVRKISGSTKPSKANAEAFDRAVHEIAHITQHLLEDLVATTPPKDREVEAAKARARSAQRFAAAS